MKKERFLISTIILIIGGALTKILGMIIRIVMTRIVGTDGISLYMLIFPTFSLFMTISQLGFPIAISKLVSEDRYNNKNVVFSIIPFSLIINIFLMIVIILIAKPLSVYLLKDYRCYYPILAISLVLPFDSLSSILRGYFFGKQKMIPHVVSNIFEQIVRLILIIIIIPKILNNGLSIAVTGLISVNIISELSSILILFLFIPKSFKLRKCDIKPDLLNVKEILRIALPTTGGRIIGSIGYFFEPILITLSASISGTNSFYIIKQYGIIEGYVMPILLLPGFFTNAISSALLPVISKAYSDRNITYVKKKIFQAISISLLIGIPFTIFVIVFPEVLLKFMYKTTEGSIFLRLISIPLLLYYIQAPLATVLQSIGKAKYIMTENTKAIILRSFIIFIGGIFIGIYGFLLAMCINILIVTINYYKHVKKALN